jgi:hypothetical protein
MRVLDVEDRLEPLGILVGVILVLMALGTVVGTPWTTNASVVATLIQFVGIVAMIGVGVALARLSYRSN